MILATLVGGLGSDAELKHISDTVVSNFSVGCDYRKKGEKLTQWVKCSIWGKRAEALSRYLTKGTRVTVVGHLTSRVHDGKAYLDCEVLDVRLQGGGQRENSGGNSREEPPRARQEAAPPAEESPDDFPF